MEFRWTPSARKQFDELPKAIQRRISDRILTWAAHPTSLNFGKSLKGRSAGLHRFRVGSYRLVVEPRDRALVILRVADRKDVYR